MLLLQSFIHRHRLADIIARWMVNEPAPGDVADLKRIVNFNIFMIQNWLFQVVRQILTALHGTAPAMHPFRTKGALKDFVVKNATYTTPRIEELCATYLERPEDFYRETPIHGAFFTIPGARGPVYAGSGRIKRFRRTAEKGSRRIVDYLVSRIEANADSLAEERARKLGLSRDKLVTPHEVGREEFVQAESRLLKTIKGGGLRHELPLLAIPDIAGAKLIVEQEDGERLAEMLGRLMPCTVVEVEKHRGDFNATNMRVRYTIPRDHLRASRPSGRSLEVLAWRGLDRDAITNQYQQFIDEGEEEVSFEIIVSTFQEFLESEIGRSLHEERVLRMRRHPYYNGFLANNVRYLMEFIFGVCRSPFHGDLTEIPVKLWVKYVPETIDQLILELYVPVKGAFGPEGEIFAVVEGDGDGDGGRQEP